MELREKKTKGTHTNTLMGLLLVVKKSVLLVLSNSSTVIAIITVLTLAYFIPGSVLVPFPRL